MNTTHRNFDAPKGQRVPSKPLTDYGVPRALERIHLYLDVLEAHFAAIADELTKKATATQGAREESTKGRAP